MHKSVYLAGPISGLSYEEATAWRNEMTENLRRFGISAVSPLRAKTYLADQEQIADEYDQTMSTSRGIMTRDRFDASQCDVLFVNFLGTKRVSIGTCMEIAWADMLRKPIVIAIEPENNIHDHAMIREALGFRVSTLEEAEHIIQSILGDY